MWQAGVENSMGALAVRAAGAINEAVSQAKTEFHEFAVSHVNEQVELARQAVRQELPAVVAGVIAGQLQNLTDPISRLTTKINIAICLCLFSSIGVISLVALQVFRSLH